jgi:lysophospholipase L1-like esterase
MLLRRSVFALLAVVALIAPAGVAVSAATGDGSPTDPNVRYFGRWDTSDPTAYVSEWAGAYLTVGFTGTTVKLKQRNTIDFWAGIDGGPDVAYTGVSGTVNLTPTPLAAGNHTLLVSYRPVAGSYHGDAVFQGLLLDPGATTYPPATSPTILEFVGDSITVGQLSSEQALTSYAWLTGGALGAEHTQIAEGGACLVMTADGCTGMSEQFFKLDSAVGAAPDWDFSRYTASAVIINLGTNDVGHGVHTPEFQDTYTQFLRDIRAVYPNAALFAMENFKARFAAQTSAAVDTVTAEGDHNVYYVDTTGWIDPGTDTVDGTHPNDQGHQKIAARLAPIIAAHV